jgi:hypothetical protein
MEITPVDDAVSAGMEAGLSRAQRFGLRFEAPGEMYSQAGDQDPLQPLIDTIDLARGMLERDEASPRFQEFFGEMLTVAAVARRAYGDDALTDSEIEDYLQRSYAWFNSFRHA